MVKMANSKTVPTTHFSEGCIPCKCFNGYSAPIHRKLQESYLSSLKLHLIEVKGVFQLTLLIHQPWLSHDAMLLMTGTTNLATLSPSLRCNWAYLIKIGAAETLLTADNVRAIMVTAFPFRWYTLSQCFDAFPSCVGSSHSTF